MPRFWSRFRNTVLIVIVAVQVTACATSGVPRGEPSPVAPAAGTDGRVADLYEQYAHWRGTAYRLGGLGEQGIDCSGLAYVVFRDLFGRQLPRTTGQQVKLGQSVAYRALEPGDLVFFKTGWRQRHVGIYMQDGWFMHASVSSGVRLSNLADGYWHQRYWKARRLPATRMQDARAGSQAARSPAVDH